MQIIIYTLCVAATISAAVLAYNVGKSLGKEEEKEDFKRYLNRMTVRDLLEHKKQKFGRL
tara:strand:- start:298 stop:477 length:180 start_codon:yes stop_codon:yes gene_type:complete